MITVRGQILVGRTDDDHLLHVFGFKTSPCVRSKGPRVYRHHAHMLKHMCAWCWHTRGRFECTHGDVFESTYGFFQVFQRAATHSHTNTETHTPNTHQTHTTITNNTTTITTHTTQHNTQHHTETETQRGTERQRKRDRERDTTQHNTTQHNTTQHNTTQDKTRQDKTQHKTQHKTQDTRHKRQETRDKTKRRQREDKGKTKPFSFLEDISVTCFVFFSSKGLVR